MLTVGSGDAVPFAELLLLDTGDGDPFVAISATKEYNNIHLMEWSLHYMYGVVPLVGSGDALPFVELLLLDTGDGDHFVVISATKEYNNICIHLMT